MNVIPNIDLSNYERAFTVIDTHTQGEFTRIVLDGMPKIEGSTMVEKRKYLQEHYSHLREALLLEPRGHKDCFGAVSYTHLPQKRRRPIPLVKNIWTIPKKIMDFMAAAGSKPI